MNCHTGTVEVGLCWLVINVAQIYLAFYQENHYGYYEEKFKSHAFVCLKANLPLDSNIL